MIELKNITKSFDDKKVLDSFSAVFDEGGQNLVAVHRRAEGTNDFGFSHEEDLPFRLSGC